jgi:Flp pilus assembly protein TadD
LLLLAPVIGLTPSGLQATADRYMYVPSVIVALAAGVAVARWTVRLRRASAAAVAIVVVVMLAVLAGLTWRQTRYWHDSIALWTRAFELDPHNDVASYNLAVAFADAGREEDAIRAYDATLRLVPDHDLARRNLAMLEAARTEREADRFASAGQLDEAEGLYARALSLDGTRLHARAAHGVLLMRRGRVDEAVPELRQAFDGGVKDPEVPNALAFGLAQQGDPAAAAAILRRALADHPGNRNLEHNLALLLAGK